MRHIKRLLVGFFLGGMLSFFLLTNRGAKMRAPGGSFETWSDESWMQLVFGASVLAALGGALFAVFTGKYNDRVIGDIATVTDESEHGAKPREATYSLAGFFLSLLATMFLVGGLVWARFLQAPMSYAVGVAGLALGGALTAAKLWHGRKSAIDVHQTGGRVRVTLLQAVVVIVTIFAIGAVITIVLTRLASSR